MSARVSFPTRASHAIGNPEPRQKSRRLLWIPAFAGITPARIDTRRVALCVMAGLIPAIHAAPLRRHWRSGRGVAALLLAFLNVTAWMAGARPAVTAKEDAGARQGRVA